MTFGRVFVSRVRLMTFGRVFVLVGCLSYLTVYSAAGELLLVTLDADGNGNPETTITRVYDASPRSTRKGGPTKGGPTEGHWTSPPDDLRSGLPAVPRRSTA
jgi:hypothetical protein